MPTANNCPRCSAEEAFFLGNAAGHHQRHLYRLLLTFKYVDHAHVVVLGQESSRTLPDIREHFFHSRSHRCRIKFFFSSEPLGINGPLFLCPDFFLSGIWLYPRWCRRYRLPPPVCNFSLRHRSRARFARSEPAGWPGIIVLVNITSCLGILVASL